VNQRRRLIIFEGALKLKNDGADAVVAGDMAYDAEAAVL
jgi:hypothetical protein